MRAEGWAAKLTKGVYVRETDLEHQVMAFGIGPKLIDSSEYLLLVGVRHAAGITQPAASMQCYTVGQGLKRCCDLPLA